MKIIIKYEALEPLSKMLSKYDEFIYTFVFETNTHIATKIINDETPLAFLMANKLIKDIQLFEGVFPSFDITCGELVYNPKENDLNVLKSMFLKYILSHNISVEFKEIDFDQINDPLVKFLYDDFDMGFVHDADGEIINYDFRSYNSETKSIEIDVSNNEKINLSVESEDITFDDILSISKSIYIKKHLVG